MINVWFKLIGVQVHLKKLGRLPILCCLYQGLPLHPYHPLRHAVGKIPNVDAVEVYSFKHLFRLANGRTKFEAERRRLSMVEGSDSYFADTVGLGVKERATVRLAAELAGHAKHRIKYSKQTSRSVLNLDLYAHCPTS